MGTGKSKWNLGGSHHPPQDPGGQKLVPVTVIEVENEWHQRLALGPFGSHLIMKQAPHAFPP
jgi:hypothetical protein